MIAARTDTVRIRVIDGELDVTAEIRAPWLLPPVTTTYSTPRARLRRLAGRVRRSQFADELRAAAHAAFWPSVICAGLVVGFTILVATRGSYLGWDGLHTIPTGGAR